jgi:phospholipid/cholesterol/gamma-HCH transport system substrate-binding protein
MEPKGSNAVVGFFVLVLGVAAVATILWLAGYGRGSHETYLVRMKESVSGLVEDAAVKYRGVDVGRVAVIGLRPDDPETIELRLEIDPRTPVREDTRAQLEFQGLTGLAFINLVGGSRDARPLGTPPGEEFPVIESVPSLLARLDTGVSGLIVSLQEASDQLSGTLEAVDRESLARTLEGLDRVTASLASRSGEIEKGAADASRLFANAAKASERLPELVTRMEELSVEWSEASANVKDLAATGREELSNASSQVSSETQLLTEDLRRVLSRLDRVVAELELDPSVVLYGRDPERRGPGE